MNKVFNEFSFEIFQFLDSEDLTNLKMANKSMNEIVECHFLFKKSIFSLNDLFKKSVEIKENKPKSSKLKEKYNFNKSLDEFYKGSDVYKERIESARKRPKK